MSPSRATTTCIKTYKYLIESPSKRSTKHGRRESIKKISKLFQLTKIDHHTHTLIHPQHSERTQVFHHQKKKTLLFSCSIKFVATKSETCKTTPKNVERDSEPACELFLLENCVMLLPDSYHHIIAVICTQRVTTASEERFFSVIVSLMVLRCRSHVSPLSLAI